MNVDKSAAESIRLPSTHILIGVSRELVEDKKSATLVEATGEPLSDFMACACRSR